jgi:hypothetical protein
MVFSFFLSYAKTSSKKLTITFHETLVGLLVVSECGRHSGAGSIEAGEAVLDPTIADDLAIRTALVISSSNALI